MDLNLGDLLIAPTTIPDSRFRDTVIMLCQHGPGGAMGLCLNKPSNHTLADLSQELEITLNPDTPIYWGGPVSPRTIWMLHSSEWSLDEHTVEINEEWSMTSNTRMFYHISDGDMPNRFRFMHGYAAWAADQLEAEVKGEHPWKPQHSWLIAQKPDPEWLFDMEENQLWAASASLCANQAVAQWM